MLANIILNILEDNKKEIPLHQSTQIPLLLQYYDYFEYQKDSRNIIRQLCQKVEYHYQPKNTFLFHKNQFSDYLYILLEGEALKLVEKDEYDIGKEIQLLNQERQMLSQIKQLQNQQQDVSKLKAQYNLFKMDVQQQLNKNEAYDKLIKDNCGLAYKNTYFNQYIDEDVNIFKVAQKFTVGNMFGHISCVDQFEQKRKFSVFASEECRFICIKLSFIQQIFQQKIIMRSYIYNYLKCLDIDLASLVDSKFFNQYFEELTFNNYDQVITQNERNDNCFYIILQGQFQYTFELKRDSTKDNSFYEDKKQLLELYQDNMFGHEYKVNNNTNNSNSLNKNKSNSIRQFGVVCKEDKSKVIRIQYLLLLSRINQESFYQIIDLGKQLQQNLEQQIGQQLPIIKKLNTTQQNNQFQINNQTNKFQEQIQCKSKQSLNTQESDSESPTKIKSCLTKLDDSPVRFDSKKKVTFRNSFSKICLNQSKRNSPIILRDSPKIKIQQKIKLNSDVDLNKIIDEDNSENLENLIDSPSKIQFKKVRQNSYFDFLINNRTPQSCNNKLLRLGQNFISIDLSSSNSQQDVKQGFQEAVSQYLKSQNQKKSPNVQPSASNQIQNALSITNKQNRKKINANRSASMVLFPSIIQQVVSDNKNDKKNEGQLQQNNNNLVEKNSYNIFNRQGSIFSQDKKKQDLQKSIQQLRYSYFSQEGLKNFEIYSPLKSKISQKQIIDSDKSQGNSPTFQFQRKSQILSKRPSLALDLKLLNLPQRIQVINQQNSQIFQLNQQTQS